MTKIGISEDRDIDTGWGWRALSVMERDSKGAGKSGKGRGKGKSGGDDAVRCATGCGKPGTKRCNGCKAVFYCSVECQRIHWKKNGHKVACKKTQVRVAAALASPAGGARTHAGGSSTKEASVCIICLDVGDPPPIQSGCGCRGDAGLAHVGCRAKAAAHKRRSSGNPGGWERCTTCGQAFTGHMARGLAEAWWSAVKNFDEKDEERQLAGNLLASALGRQGRYAECEAMCRELRAVQRRMSSSDPVNAGLNVLQTAQTLGIALHSQKKYVEAEVVIRELVSKRREMLGAEHRDTLSALMVLGDVFSGQGKFDDALEIYIDVRTLRGRVLGAENMKTLATTMNIATTLQNQHKVGEAEVMYRELLRVQQRVVGAEHPATLATRESLCVTLYNQSKFTEAEARCRELLPACHRVLGAEHPETIRASQLLALISKFM